MVSCSFVLCYKKFPCDAALLVPESISVDDGSGELEDPLGFDTDFDQEQDAEPATHQDAVDDEPMIPPSEIRITLANDPPSARPIPVVSSSQAVWSEEEGELTVDTSNGRTGQFTHTTTSRTHRDGSFSRFSRPSCSSLSTIECLAKRQFVKNFSEASHENCLLVERLSGLLSCSVQSLL